MLIVPHRYAFVYAKMIPGTNKYLSATQNTPPLQKYVIYVIVYLMKQDQKMRLVGKVLVGIIVIVLLVAVMQNLALYGFSGKTYYASIVPPGGAYSTSLLPAYEAVNVDTC